MDVAHDKKRLRAAMTARRDAAAAEDRGESAKALLARFEETVISRLDHNMYRVVSAFWPTGSEIDVRPVMAHLVRRGFTVGLPVVVAKATPLVFRRWYPGAPMARGMWNIPVPDGTEKVHPDVMLVPLLAFDERGHRLGYGGGFYDRTIDRLNQSGHRPLTIGIARQCQKIDAVPHESWDEKLDMVITDGRSYVFGPPSEKVVTEY